MDTIRLRPTREQLLASHNMTVPDIIAPNMRVLFCGINPGLYSAWAQHHFARPGNRFWPAMYGGGFTPRLYSAYEDYLIAREGLGLTNVVDRATNSAAELRREEFIAGGEILRAKIALHRPKWLAVVGMQAYRVAFADPKATVGPQDRTIGETRIWVLPNPSGLNAHYLPASLAVLFGELNQASQSA
jgi:TDG/mug DNA glycosylase family protein